MNTESLPDEAGPAASAEPELRGPVLDVLRTLLGDHQERDAVLSIVSELPAASAAAAAQRSRMPIHVRRTHV